MAVREPLESRGNEADMPPGALVPRQRQKIDQRIADGWGDRLTNDARRDLRRAVLWTFFIPPVIALSFAVGIPLYELEGVPLGIPVGIGLLVMCLACIGRVRSLRLVRESIGRAHNVPPSSWRKVDITSAARLDESLRRLADE